MEDNNNFLFYIFPFDSCSPPSRAMSCQGSLECTTTSVLNYIIISFTATIHPSIHLTKSPVIGTLAHDMRNILKNTSVYYYHPFHASWMDGVAQGVCILCQISASTSTSTPSLIPSPVHRPCVVFAHNGDNYRTPVLNYHNNSEGDVILFIAEFIAQTNISTNLM